METGISTELPVAESTPNDSNTRSRKRRRIPENWTVNIRKRKRHSGQAYQDRKGKLHAARSIKTTKDCRGKCKFSCLTHCNEGERDVIFHQYWQLTRNRQQEFLAKHTVQSVKSNVKRLRIKYTLPVLGESVRVCKEFFLGALDISQQRVNIYHKNKGQDTNVPRPLQTGNNNKATSDEKKASVRNHIMSFPIVESHYCRSSSKCQYLDPGLSIAKMYRLYTQRMVGT